MYTGLEQFGGEEMKNFHFWVNCSKPAALPVSSLRHFTHHPSFSHFFKHNKIKKSRQYAFPHFYILTAFESKSEIMSFVLSNLHDVSHYMPVFTIHP